MRPHDTSQAAYDVQLAFYRRLTPAQRVDLAVQMCEAARETARAGIRARHPEYTVEQVHHALMRVLLGDDLFRRAWPDAPLLAA